MTGGGDRAPIAAAAARFRDVLTELPLDVGTLADQRAVQDAIEALTVAAERASAGTT